MSRDRGVFVVLAIVCSLGAACDSSPNWRHELNASSSSTGAPGRSSGCDEERAQSLDGLPDSFSCTGLYRNIATKEIADGIREYAPSVPLWSDGAEKRRWVSLPEGTQIDASDPSAWIFPVGTRFFKEFKVDDRRVETRFLQKVRDDRWVRSAYQWNADESEAKRVDGADLDDVQLNDTTYHIPSGRECNQCHEGREDRILGFEAISLGLPNASGVSLQQLVDDHLLMPPPDRTSFEIGDDGTGMGGEVLGWLHINCGVTCHNDNPNAQGYDTQLRLRMNPDDLDGRASNDFPTIKTTIGVHGKTNRWTDQVRIVPGSPEDSLLFKLITSRKGKNDQMPPVGTKVVDQQHADLIEAWIRALPAE